MIQETYDLGQGIGASCHGIDTFCVIIFIVIASTSDRIFSASLEFTVIIVVFISQKEVTK